MAPVVDLRPVVVHVVYRFDTGGLENGVVNLINKMPVSAYRHVVLALTEVTDFRLRIVRSDVEFIALNKASGHAIWLYPRLFKLFRALHPAIVHTRNLAALEVVVPAWLAGVKVRVHGEHGRDQEDLAGLSKKHQWIRRIYSPFVSHYLALSRDLAGYLLDKVKIRDRRVTQAYNGVDSGKFRPFDSDLDALPADFPFRQPYEWIVGTVGRMQVVKDQLTLSKAVVRAIEIAPDLKAYLRLVMVGDGPLREQCQAILDSAGLSDISWLPGERQDIAELMRSLDCFVLPSLAEGISNTILEAMASGLPVIATEVGGNADLVVQGETGLLVPSNDPEALARSLVQLATAPVLAKSMGRAGRQLAEEKFSMAAMVATYQGLYDRLLGAATVAVQTPLNTK
ncbi:MAG: TIGR03088 family PEP-CTERM/XrtA system glycosyltransferase [Burkholderiales bacterium]|nr:TIGR03088 family PEP-CTERM/XrtA system glycosyltransferase [Burkholderiales bacterium]